MSRSAARELAVHLIYSRAHTGQTPSDILQSRMDEAYYAGLAEENSVYDRLPNEKQRRYIEQCLCGVAEHEEAITQALETYSIKWKTKRISRLTLAILKLAVYELVFMDEVPDGAAINEAVALTKKYEGEQTGAFVNGILGSFVRDGKKLQEGGETPEEEGLPV